MLVNKTAAGHENNSEIYKKINHESSRHVLKQGYLRGHEPIFIKYFHIGIKCNSVSERRTKDSQTAGMSLHIFLATMVPRQYRVIIIYIAITLFSSVQD